jgi:hypothetical protein
MMGWRINIASQAKGSENRTDSLLSWPGVANSNRGRVYLAQTIRLTFTFCLQQGGGPYTGVPSKLWSGMSRFPEKEKSGRVRIRGSLRRIIYDRSRNRELSRDVSFCVQLR